MQGPFVEPICNFQTNTVRLQGNYILRAHSSDSLSSSINVMCIHFPICCPLVCFGNICELWVLVPFYPGVVTVLMVYSFPAEDFKFLFLEGWTIFLFLLDTFDK